jgi:MFS family permease
MTPGAKAGALATATPGSFVLILLSAVYALNVLDRSIFGVLLPPIKAELHISDTLIGLMSGAGFAVFYTTLGFPIARLADRWSRKWIITACLAAFSVMTVFCGIARTPLQLFAARIGVAVGEAGTNPSSFAMIGDRYPEGKRSHAMAVLTAGANVGILLGFVAGGLVAGRYGWRVAFAAVGLPGVVLAVATALFLPAGRPGGPAGPKPPGVLTTLKTLWTASAFRHTTVGAGLVLFMINGLNVWLPSFLSRSFHLPTQRISVFMGLAIGVGGFFGTLLLSGGFVDRLQRRDLRWPAWFVAIIAPSTSLLLLPVFLARDGASALGFFIAPAILTTVFQAPSLAMAQALAPPSMRATANAAFLFVSNLIGLGLGPLVIGGLSDLFAANGFDSAAALKAALLCILPVGAWAALHYYLASRTLERDCRAALLT